MNYRQLVAKFRNALGLSRVEFAEKMNALAACKPEGSFMRNEYCNLDRHGVECIENVRDDVFEEDHALFTELFRNCLDFSQAEFDRAYVALTDQSTNEAAVALELQLALSTEASNKMHFLAWVESNFDSLQSAKAILEDHLLLQQ